MSLTTTTKKEVLFVYDIWLHSYLNGDVATYNSYLDESFHFIGSTANEEFLNRKNTANFFKATADQLSGKSQVRNETKIVEQFGELVFITHLFDAWFLAGDDWSFYSRFRFTNALQKKKEGWRFIYQHYSTPDTKAQEGETIGFDQISAENLQLREAIQRRTKELETKNRALEVETALEKVRSRSMGMQNSNELKEVIQVVYNQFIQLNIKIEHTGFILDYKENDDMHIWLADQNAVFPQITLPYFDCAHWNSFNKAKKNGTHFFTNQLDFEEKNKFYKDLFQFIPALPEEVKKHYFTCPALAISTVLLDNVGLYIENYESIPFTDEENAILMRFGNVFQQTYTRFLDLQKAEAQAIEAQIEASLERVRSKTLAMHSSQDVGNTMVLLFEELESLGIKANRNGIIILDEEEHGEIWTAKSNINNEVELMAWKLDMSLHDLTKQVYKAWKNKNLGTIYSLIGDNLKSYYKTLNKFTDIPVKFNLETFPEKEFCYTFNFSEGFIYLFTDEEIVQEHEQIPGRFASVFAQTYRRYQDLQKAEAQTREAQINLAVERVRAKALAMHKSEEIMEVVAKLKEEVMALDIPDVISATIFLKEGEDEVRMWDLSSLEKNNDVYEIPFDITFKLKKKDPHLYVKRVWENQDNYFHEKQEAKDFKRIVAWLRENDKTHVADEVEEFTENTQLKQLYHAVKKLNNGKLAIDLLNPPTDEMETILTKMGAAFDLAYKRFEDLQKAEAQAREAQIETSLERVRSRSMAMHSSDELTDAGALLYSELTKLGIENLATGYVLFDENEKMGWNYGVNPKDGSIRHKPVGMLHTKNKVMKSIKASWKKLQPLLVLQLNPEETIKHQTFIAEESINFPISKKDLLAISPERLVVHTFNFKQGYLLIVGGMVLTNAQQQMVVRFANVFQQTYTRFLDLQKAEAQARESQIEVALERVRSKAMAMHSSSDLSQTVNAFFNELKILNLSMRRCGVGIVNVEKKTVDVHVTTETLTQDSKMMTGMLTLSGHPILDTIFETFMRQEEYHPVLRGKELLDYYKRMNPEVEYPDFTNDDVQYGYYFYFKEGGVFTWTEKELLETDLQIFRRYTSVLSLTYRRYLDLKEAEAQAHEAKIEASLEKVRNVALTLKKSDDMLDIAQVLYEQLLLLGFTDIRNAIIDIHNDETETFIDYDYSHDMSSAATEFSYYGDPVIEQQIKKTQSAHDAFFEIELKGEQLEELIETRLRNGEKDDPRLREVDHLTYNLYSFGNGAIGISNFGILTEDQKNILKRFRNVFTFAYKRYTDLANAEAQALEAKIEAALERVRSVALGLNTSEDMLQVAQALYEQLQALGFENIRNSIIDIDNEDGDTFSDYDYSDEMGGTVTQMSYKDDPTLKEQLKDIIATTDGFSEMVLEGQQLQDLIDMRRNNGEADDPRLLNTDSLSYILYAFGKGAIGISNFGKLTDPQKTILSRFRNVFTFAYQRYTDLAQSEAQAKALLAEKQQLEKTLSDLQATQKQLIQSEKMASLGELTAGIAHEIQNPLNFVNNFSEVSNELIEEIDEEMAKGDMEEVKLLLNDIKQNLEKINHHGKRADAIVKGMLQHSRKSTAEKVPTDINKLADEYLRLAYHGLRAKDKSFNATLETDFDENIGLVNVIPQDMGRVILNLITNAFYSTNERKKVPPASIAGQALAPEGGIKKYEPTVSVSTKRISPLRPASDEEGTTKRNALGEILISVKDNGNGIPKHVVDKIFQPFFTTKPTGEGTGLGLSMSYDIITKGHGGELTVETEENQGTTFTIVVPI